jgi:hypothetical protein
LALWLETVAADRPLTFLDHHLRHGNSLIGAGLDDLAALPGETGMFAEGFAKVFDRKLPALLGPLAAIRELPSESAKQVKAKESRFAEFQRVVDPFWQLADLWCAAVIGDDPDADQYHAVLDEVDKSGRFKRLAVKDWFKGATQLSRGLAAFHWELAFPDAYFAEGGRRDRPGFDAVIGNPPYEVLSERESGQDLSALRAFIDAEPAYAPSQRGKNNLYKLFICRALDLLADGGRLGFITPMAVLGDDQAADLRRAMLQAGRFTAVEAFPQKDDPKKRVFPEAKLSTAVFILKKGMADDLPFRARIHPGRDIEDGSPGLALTTAAIPLYDPSNCTIVSCAQADWDLATRIMRSDRMGRLGELCVSFQGEVNETNEKNKCLSKRPTDGPLILRGANVCLYTIREASQGKDYYINVNKFFRGKRPDAKAFHSKEERVGFQRSSPQNNFRRIVAAIIEPNNFCFDTISYVPQSQSQLPLQFLLGLLNSMLLDWYFRLGSTNSKVNEYQFNNLPCPHFAKKVKEKDAKLQAKAEAAVAARRPEDALDVLRPLLAEPPFSPAVRAVIVAAVQQIMRIEADRGEIARTDRSALDPDAQPYQDLIDQLLYAMAGLSAAEVRGLEERYATML